MLSKDSQSAMQQSVKKMLQYRLIKIYNVLSYNDIREIGS